MASLENGSKMISSLAPMGFNEYLLVLIEVLKRIVDNCFAEKEKGEVPVAWNFSLNELRLSSCEALFSASCKSGYQAKCARC